MLPAAQIRQGQGLQCPAGTRQAGGLEAGTAEQSQGHTCRQTMAVPPVTSTWLTLGLSVLLDASWTPAGACAEQRRLRDLMMPCMATRLKTASMDHSPHSHAGRPGSVCHLQSQGARSSQPRSAQVHSRERGAVNGTWPRSQELVPSQTGACGGRHQNWPSQRIDRHSSAPAGRACATVCRPARRSAAQGS